MTLVTTGLSTSLDGFIAGPTTGRAGLQPIAAGTRFELQRAVDAQGVTHLIYRVLR